MKLIKPLHARRPDLGLGAILLGRVSTEQQDLANIDASFLNLKRVLNENRGDDAEVEMRLMELGEQASGMRATRKTIDQAKALIATREWDVVLAEDLGRIFRNPQSLWEFLGFAVDHDVRVICPNDGVDTAAPEFLMLVHCGALRHGLMVEETRKRIIRTAIYNFRRGGMVTKHRFAYRRLSKEESAGLTGVPGLRIARCEEFAPIVREMCDRVLRGESYTSIARWLNDSEIPPGPYATTGRWRDSTVKGFLRSPILHGERTFRDVVHIPSLSGGRPRIVRDPSKLERSFHPELAFLTVEEHDRVLKAMAERGRLWSRQSGENSPMFGRPRSRSRWPGQVARCGVCSGPMHIMGKSLWCARAHESPTRCWNKGLTPIVLLNGRTVDYLLSLVEAHPGFRKAIVSVVWEAQLRCGKSKGNSIVSVDAKIESLEAREANYVTAVGKSDGKIDSLLTALAKIQAELESLRAERRNADEHYDCGEFRSREEVDQQIELVLRENIDDSFDLAELFRKVIVGVTIIPVQECLTAQVRPRALLEVDLTSLSGGDLAAAKYSTFFDVFNPPQHIRLFDRVEALRTGPSRLSLSAIAKQLGVNHMAVKRTVRYIDRFRESGRREHYEPLQNPPSKASRWRGKPAA